MEGKDVLTIEPIAYIRTPFVEKFGIPRQSGLVAEALGKIVFEPKYRDPDALRGLETYSHLWLIWGFSENKQEGFSPMVRPPRLGGNEKRGVFASRSPFRPNGLGLSAVKIERIERTEHSGPHIIVCGVDLMDRTPIYDIKPYQPYTDSIGNASGGYAEDPDEGVLEVVCPDRFLQLMGDDAPAILAVLSRDPRPAYHDDPERIYKMDYASCSIGFRVHDGAVEVVGASKLGEKGQC